MEKHISQWLAAYHDGELRGRRLAQVEAHLADCPECLEELEMLNALSSLLDQASDAPLLTSPDRFVAQVGLRLPRRKLVKPQAETRKAWVWAALPVSLMVAMGFLWTVQWLTAGLELAQLFGFGEEAISRLTSAPVQPTSLLGEVSAEFIRFGVPFSPQFLIGVILPAILAIAYLLWLILWGLNQQESETI
jgi:anti-sigma factor RsiW